MPQLIEPTPQLIRREIEEIKDPEVRMFAKVILTCGGRTVEFANKNCNREKAYGTIGKGYAWLEDYQPKTVTNEELTQRLNKLSDNPNINVAQIMTTMMKPPAPVKALILKVPIAKKHLLEGESIVYRHTAIPYDTNYEPWAPEILEWYEQRGKEPLFINNRKHYLDYLNTRKVFKQFYYPIERYTIRTNCGKLETVPEGDGKLRYFKRSDKSGVVFQYDAKPQHLHPFKFHGCRHVRTKELNDFYEIRDTLALCSFIGWAPARGANTMIARYGDLYKNWGSYFGNLLRIRPKY